MSDRSATQLVTPRARKGGSIRKQMFVSAEDAAKMKRGRAWEADMTDVNTGIMYRLVGCACSLPNCFCDAYIAQSVDRRH